MSDTTNNTNKPAEASQNQDFTSTIEQGKLQDGARHEISGTAIARMMGVATSTELRLLETKLDLISGRLNNLGVKVDKIISLFSGLPTGSDMERIDVQIGSVKSLMRDLTLLVSGNEPQKVSVAPGSKPQETQIVEPEVAAVAAEASAES